MSVIEVGLVIWQQNPWLAYSPDGVVFIERNIAALLEIKCVFKGKKMTITEAMKCKAVKKFLGVDDQNNVYLKEKHMYYGQVQLGMAILNVPLTYFVLYASFDESMIIVNVPFDYKFCETMLVALKKKFFSQMLHFLCIKNTSSVDQCDNNSDVENECDESNIAQS